MEIRAATRDDLADIIRLHAANWRRDYAQLLPASVLATKLDPYLHQKWGADALSRGYVAVAVNDRFDIIGFAHMLCTTNRNSPTFLDNLHVADIARGRGAGRQLMAHVAERAGSGALELEVFEDNGLARRIYRSWGGTEGPKFRSTILGVAVAAHLVSWPDASILARRLAKVTNG